MEKGQISVQFNWIFVIIIGGVILLFFLGIIRAQVKESDYELTGDILRNLDTIVKSSEQKPDSTNVIKIPEIPLNFVCEPGISYYNIGSGGQNDITYDIIFAQKKMTGKTLVSWTQSWDVPFRIAIFQYLTTKNARFIVVDDSQLIGDGSLADQLYELLPENISKEIIPREREVKDFNYDYYKIIQFEGKKLSNSKIKVPENLVYIITINVDKGLNSYGTITFEKEGETVGFVKKEALLGAIFSDDAAYYNCTMEKAYERLDLLMKLNKERVSALEKAKEDTECETYYTWANQYFNSIRFPSEGVKTIYEKSENLKSDNENLIRGPDCPLIY
ncbi:MAG: hypothetical protein ABH828_02775 [archaeon]